MNSEKQHAHALLDRVPTDQLTAAIRFLEFLLLDPVGRALAIAPIDDEEITEEEKQAVACSKEWFQHNPGTPFEEVVAELGFTMEQVYNHTSDDEKHPAA